MITMDKKVVQKGRPRRAGKGSYRSGAIGITITERNKMRRLLKHIRHCAKRNLQCDDAIEAYQRYGGKITQLPLEVL